MIDPLEQELTDALRACLDKGGTDGAVLRLLRIRNVAVLLHQRAIESTNEFDEVSRTTFGPVGPHR